MGSPTANDLSKSLRTVQGLAAFCRPRGRFQTGAGVLASGIVGILLSFYLLANLTTTAVWLLGVLLLGIQLICEAVALSSLAWRVRRSA